MGICKVDGCEGKHRAKGYCYRHYTQWYTYGKTLNRTKYDPNKIIIKDVCALVEIYDISNLVKCYAKISIQDINIIKRQKWQIDNHGYIVAHGAGRMHNYILGRKADRRIVCDHINRDKLDNRRCNLRIVRQSVNSFNTGLRSSNSSGVTGVTFCKQKNIWHSYIRKNYRLYHLGFFILKNDAIDARKKAELRYYGELV